jgi:hypothetical protein
LLLRIQQIITMSLRCPDDLVTSSGGSVSTSELRVETVAIVFADPSIPSCNEAILALTAHFATTDSMALIVVPVSMRDADVESLFEPLQGVANASRVYAFPAPFLLEHGAQLKSALGLGAALLLPEVVVVDVASGLPLSTDMRSFLASLKARPNALEAIKARGWRSDCCVVAALEDVDPSGDADDRRGYSALLSDAGLAQAGLYSGDPVLVKPLGRILLPCASSASPAVASVAAEPVRLAASSPPRGLSLCLYVNPPAHAADDAGDDDEDGDGGAKGSSADAHRSGIAPHVILLSSQVRG